MLQSISDRPSIFISHIQINYLVKLSELQASMNCNLFDRPMRRMRNIHISSRMRTCMTSIQRGPFLYKVSAELEGI